MCAHRCVRLILMEISLFWKNPHRQKAKSLCSVFKALFHDFPPRFLKTSTSTPFITAFNDYNHRNSFLSLSIAASLLTSLSAISFPLNSSFLVLFLYTTTVLRTQTHTHTPFRVQTNAAHLNIVRESLFNFPPRPSLTPHPLRLIFAILPSRSLFRL